MRETLFGDDYPAPAPRKGAPGYLTWLAALDWPDGWRFWALAGSVGRASASTEWVYLIKRGTIREALVDLNTGSLTRWGDRT